VVTPDRHCLQKGTWQASQEKEVGFFRNPSPHSQLAAFEDSTIFAEHIRQIVSEEQEVQLLMMQGLQE